MLFLQLNFEKTAKIMLIKIPFYKTFVCERQKNIFFNKTLFCLCCLKHTTLYNFFPGIFTSMAFHYV